MSINRESDDENLITISSDFQNVGPAELQTLAAINLADIDSNSSVIGDVLELIDTDISTGSLTLPSKADAEAHLTESSKQITEAKGEPAESVNLVGKLMRTDHIQLSNGGTLCYLDLTDQSGSDEVADKIGKMLIEYDESTLTIRSGSNDSYSGCSLDPDGAVDTDSTEPYTQSGMSPTLPASELNGFKQNTQRVDVEFENGVVKITAEDETVGDMSYDVADDSIQDQRNSYHYDAGNGVIFDHQRRFAKISGGALADREGRLEQGLPDDINFDPYAYVRNSMNESESLAITYEVDNESDAPRQIDLSSTCTVVQSKAGCGNTVVATYTFNNNSFTVEGGEFSGSDCQVSSDVDCEYLYADRAETDMWFFAANGNRPLATLAQLNSRVQWDEDGSGPDPAEIARWSYRPKGNDWSQGVLFRYKENGSGQITHTEVYRCQ